MAESAANNRLPDKNFKHSMNDEDLFALKNFNTSLRLAIQKICPPTTGPEKEISDLIIDNLFPDLFDTPATRKRNMELLIVVILNAIHFEIFLEYLFTEFQLQKMVESLQRYEIGLKKLEEVKLQQNIQQILIIEAQKLMAHRITLIKEIIRLQSSVLQLRNEIRVIYKELGTIFKDLFKDFASKHLMHADPKHEIKVSIGGGREILVNQNDLVLHLGEDIGGKIERGEIIVDRKTIHEELDKSAIPFLERIDPSCIGKIKDVALPAPLKEKLYTFFDGIYLKDERVISGISKILQKKNEAEVIAKQKEGRVNDLFKISPRLQISQANVQNGISEVGHALEKRPSDHKNDLYLRIAPVSDVSSIKIDNDQRNNEPPDPLSSNPEMPANDFAPKEPIDQNRPPHHHPDIFFNPERLNDQKQANNDIEKKNQKNIGEEDDSAPHNLDI